MRRPRLICHDNLGAMNEATAKIRKPQSAIAILAALYDVIRNISGSVRLPLIPCRRLALYSVRSTERVPGQLGSFLET
jgi:hypothetical protein